MADVVQARVTINFYFMTFHFRSSNYNSSVSVRNEFFFYVKTTFSQTRVHVNT